jgi:hypothetical protein
MQTIEEFVDACKTLNSDEIYELFEYTIGNRLRNSIFAISNETTSREPVRLRLNMLGIQYNIESLKKY